MSRLLNAIKFIFSGDEVMARLDDLTREVAEMKATGAAAAAKLKELAARIEACECDPVKLSALVAELNEAQEGLQATVDSLETPKPPPVEEEMVA